MPIIDKRDRNNWYNSIPISNQREAYNPFLDPNVDVDTLEINEVRQSYDTKIAKIPKIKHRIFRRTEGSSTHVIFLVDEWYDQEKGQMRNKKVDIGTDLGGFLPGRMIVNKDNYYKYFNIHGQLINDPLKKRREQKAKEAADKEEAGATARREAETVERAAFVQKETIEETGTETILPEQEEERSVDEIKAALIEKEKLLDEKLKQAEEGLKELEENKKVLDELQDVKVLALEEKEKAHIDLLNEFLESYIDSVREQAKRRPDGLMRLTQIRAINEILDELRNYFAGSESERYLHLAEEPREDDLEHHPGTTYGEMDILLTAYRWTVHAFRYKSLYAKD
jgi:hypothetical protein